ncbi:hypothetical protein BDR07DRAFT_1392757 [Suillus spraguei]|nr:hypothetical protein BDR07DRAFT_1392757 [Suillus spraguei]
MGFFSVARIVLFSITIAFSVIELGLNAYFLSLTVPDDFYFIFSVLGLVTTLLTIITIPIMLIVGFVRRGAFTSMIVFELSWLFTLTILWVATAGDAISTSNYYYPQGCVDTNPTVNAYCMELQAVEAFAFLNFFIFLGYTCVLLVFSIIGSSRGNDVWTRSVQEATFFAQKSWSGQVPLNQYSGAPPTGLTPVSQPQQSQQFQPVYSGQPQGISV